MPSLTLDSQQNLSDAVVRGPGLGPSFLTQVVVPALRAEGLWPEGDLESLFVPCKRALREVPKLRTAAETQVVFGKPLVRPLGYTWIRPVRGEGGAPQPLSRCLFLTKDTEATLDVFVAPPGADDLEELAELAARLCSPKPVLLVAGHEIRLLFPRREAPLRQLCVRLQGWAAKGVPESFRVLCAVASPCGLDLMTGLLHKAVVPSLEKEMLRALAPQLHRAVERFLTTVIAQLEDDQRGRKAQYVTPESLEQLYRETLELVAELALWAQGQSGRREVDSLCSLAKEILERPLTVRPESALEHRIRAIFFQNRRPQRTANGTAQPGSLWSLRLSDRGLAHLVLGILPKTQCAEMDVLETLEVLENSSVLEKVPVYATRDLCRLAEKGSTVVAPLWKGSRYRYQHAEGTRFVEEIPSGSVYLADKEGLDPTPDLRGRNQVVRFLSREALSGHVEQRSPATDPKPNAILEIRVLDPAMGTGAFLIEACRYLAERLYLAARRCVASGREVGIPLLEAALRAPSAGTVPMRARTLAICRRLVVLHCLYGVDENPRNVALAQSALGTLVQVEGLPEVQLAHRFFAGDALSGGFLEEMLGEAATGKIDARLRRYLQVDLFQRMKTAAERAERLRALFLGDGEGELTQDAIQIHLTLYRQTLLPFRLLSAAWAGRKILGGQEIHRVAYQRLLSSLQKPERGRTPLPVENLLLQMISKGLGLPRITSRTEAETRILHGDTVAALPFELVFPEVFGGERSARGFDVILALPKEAKYQAVLERATRLLSTEGAATLAMVVPGEFHLAEGAAPSRKLLFGGMHPRLCYALRGPGEPSRDLIVTDFGQPKAPREVRCAFGVTLSALSQGEVSETVIPLELLRRLGGVGAGLWEVRGAMDLDVVRTCHGRALPLRSLCQTLRVTFGDDALLRVGPPRLMPLSRFVPALFGARVEPPDPREQRARTTLLSRGLVPYFQGGELAAFDDRGGPAPQSVVLARTFQERSFRSTAGHYRLAVYGGEHSLVAAMVPGPSMFGPLVYVEQVPALRPTTHALLLLSLLGSSVASFLYARTSHGDGELAGLLRIPVPVVTPETHEDVALFLCHGALRLQANHAAFAPLWEEILGPRWQEEGPPHILPAVPPLFPEGSLGHSRRRDLRASLDAAIAHLYGLTQEQYQHVLTSHGGLHQASRELCLYYYGEAKVLGLARFVREHDPYFAVPLPKDLPLPPPGLPEAPPSYTSRERQRKIKPTPINEADASVQLVLSLFRSQKQVRFSEIQGALRWPVTKVRALVAGLLESGVLLRHGVTKASRYSLSAP